MAASEAMGLGHGGVSLVRRACGLSRKAIAKGIREIQDGEVREAPKQKPIINDDKIGRNDPCPCGSGKKYKKCCGK